MSRALGIFAVVAGAVVILLVASIMWIDGAAGLGVALVDWVLAAAALLAMTFTLLQRYNLEFYFAIQRARHRWSGRSVTWDFSVLLQCDAPATFLDGIEGKLIESFPGSVRKVAADGSRRVYAVHERFNLEVVAPDPTAEEGYPGAYSDEGLVLHILNLRVTYRESRKTLEQELMPVVSVVEQLVRPRERSYSMTVTFEKEQNPFFGLYVHWLRPENVEDFRVSLLIDHYQERDIVTVSERQIELQATSPTAFQAMARDFVTLAPELKHGVVAPP